MDQLIKHLLVSTTANFDARGNTAPVTQYSYYVGAHGPFSDRFPEGQDTAEAVNAAMQARIDKLRAVGAIS
jgi:hypothetical protein